MAKLNMRKKKMILISMRVKSLESMFANLPISVLLIVYWVRVMIFLKTKVVMQERTKAKDQTDSEPALCFKMIEIIKHATIAETYK